MKVIDNKSFRSFINTPEEMFQFIHQIGLETHFARKNFVN